MKFIVSILVYIIAAIPSGHCQNLLKGKAFVSSKMEQIEFSNDTVLTSTIQGFPDRYRLKNKTITFTFSNKNKKERFFTAYQATHVSADSILVSYIWEQSPRPDTILFVNIEKYIEPINNFDSLRIYMRGQRGYKILTIKNDKSINEIEALGENNYINNPTYNHRILTSKKYQELLYTLERSLIFKLPRQRQLTASDETRIYITISINHQILISNGGTLPGIHGELLNYLLTIK